MANVSWNRLQEDFFFYFFGLFSKSFPALSHTCTHARTHAEKRGGEERVVERIVSLSICICLSEHTKLRMIELRAINQTG